jgi:NAD(P)H-hydrate epimerase
MKRFRGPMLLDADALAVFDGDLDGLRAAVGSGSRNVVITPHPLEMARLAGVPVETVLERRFEIGVEVARKTGTAVLLKGVPTIVSGADGSQSVVATGTPVLATGGSGDLLCGIAGTLLAQMEETPVAAAAIAAWINGRAAELTGPRVRGTTLDDVLEVLPNAWNVDATPARYPILTELPAVIAT